MSAFGCCIVLVLARCISGVHITALSPSIEPIVYLHVPKSGSNFATSILHLVCGNNIEKGITVLEPNGVKELISEKCGDYKAHIGRFENAHAPLPKWAETSKAVAMLRNPKQRIISGYLHSLHDCPALQKKYNIVENPPRPPLGSSTPIAWLFKEYMQCVQSCTINMLNHRFCGQNADDGTNADRDNAVDVVNKMGFVGLTEHWELSICLWHAMFGGECLDAEFVNLHRPLNKEEQPHDESVYGDSQPADLFVYDAAKKRFAQQMEAYGVTPHSCATKYCPAVAQAFGYRSSNATAEKNPCTNLDDCTWPGRWSYYQD
jgi:hypothetical protein